MTQTKSLFQTLLFFSFLIAFCTHLKAADKDLSIRKLTVEYSCRMDNVPVYITITNSGTTPFISDEDSPLKLYYVVDKIPGSSEMGDIVYGEDTIEANIDRFVHGLGVAEDTTFALYSDIDNYFFDFGDFGEIHQIRAWIEWSEDENIENNANSMKFTNPGKDLSVKTLYDPIYEYAPGFTTEGMWTAYPKANAVDGGWNMTDTNTFIDFLGTSIVRNVISWRPSATDGVNPNMNQWLFSDCLLLNDIDEYTVNFKALTYGDTHYIELAIAKGLSPTDVVEIIDTISVYYEGTSIPFGDAPLRARFTVEESGIYHVAMRLITPVKNAQTRNKVVIDRFQIINPTPYRMFVNSAVYPGSGCSLTDNETIRIGVCNEGVAKYADSVIITLYHTFNGGDTLSITKKAKVILDAKMDYGESVFIDFKELDMQMKGLYTYWVSAQYLNEGKYQMMDLYPLVNTVILNATPSMTPYSMGFEDAENYQDWIGLSNMNGVWQRRTEGGGRNSIQRDSTPFMMEAYANSATTSVYLKSTCFQLSSDSIYTVSAWIKWVGDTVDAPDGSAIRYCIAKKPSGTEFNKTILYTNTKLHRLTEWTQFGKTFTVATDDVYYLGFHYKATGERAAIWMDDVTLKARAKVPQPTNFKVSEIHENTAKLSWDSILYSDVFYYKIYLNGTLVADSLDSTSYSLKDLSPNTDYTVDLLVWAINGDSSIVVSTTFSTLQSEIPIPQNLKITEITQGSALFSWDDVETDSVYSYTVYLDTNKVVENIRETFYRFENLSPDTKYQAGLVLLTKSMEEGFKQTLYFTTLAKSDTLSIEKTNLNLIKIYPNPTEDGVFTLQSDKEYHVRILDNGGREVFRQFVSQGTYLIDLSAYAKGVYFLYLQNKEENKVCKLIIR